MITLRQLRYIDALATTRHFGRASALLGISQPALSMQIRELEESLGSRLMERGPGGADLTELGRDIADRARRILASVSDLEAAVARMAGDLAGPVSIGIIPTIAPYLLPSFIALAAERYPRLKLTVREGITPQLVGELRSGRLDAIVASVPLGTDEFEEATAFEDRFVLAAPAGSDVAIRSPAVPEDIDSGELLLLEDGHCLRDQALAVCGTINPSRLNSFGMTSLATVIHLVAAGHGMTLLPEIAAAEVRRSNPRIRLINFARPTPSRMVGIAWRRSSPRSGDFRALAAVLRDAAAMDAAAEAA